MHPCRSNQANFSRRNLCAFTLIDPRLPSSPIWLRRTSRGPSPKIFVSAAPRDDGRVSGFTIIELLVVIAILAVLAVVVVLTLNPAGLLQESRDSNRLQDMATLNSAIGYFLADAPLEPLGTSTLLYVSVPDPTATSTAGDQCQGLGLPSLSGTGFTYQCASPTYYRKADGTGWIPVNLAGLTFGTPLANLPTDPINATSSGLYYTYAESNGQFEVASVFESQKYKLQYGNSPMDPGYPEVDAKGSNLGLIPLWNPTGLVGWWPLNEGGGSSAQDQSGNGNGGSWSGNASGTSGYYAGGKVSTWAGYFDGSTDYISAAPGSSTLNFANGAPFSISVWVYNFNPTGASYPTILDKGFSGGCADNYALFLSSGFGKPRFEANSGGGCPGNHDIVSNTVLNPNAWYNIVGTFDGATMTLYLNAVSQASLNIASTLPATTTAPLYIGIGNGGGELWNGLINDVRIYNRALSSAEIQALYDAEK